MKLTEEHHKWIAESTPTEGTSSAEKAHWILGAEEAIQKFGGVQWNKYPEMNYTKEIDGIIAWLTETDGGHAVGEGDIKCAVSDLRTLKQALDNLFKVSR